MKKKLKDLTASDILEICDNFFLKRENRCSHNCPLYGYKSNKCRASYRQQHRDQEIEYRFAEGERSLESAIFLTLQLARTQTHAHRRR